MSPDELLERMAQTLKQEIGPAVAADYPRTQAFMTSVVLQKLAKQVRLAAEHAAADCQERRELLDDLGRLLPRQDSPEALRFALDTVRANSGDANVCHFIEALYAAREQLGAAQFDTVLKRVRQTLRAGLNRQMAYAS